MHSVTVFYVNTVTKFLMLTVSPGVPLIPLAPSKPGPP